MEVVPKHMPSNVYVYPRGPRTQIQKFIQISLAHWQHNNTALAVVGQGYPNDNLYIAMSPASVNSNDMSTWEYVFTVSLPTIRGAVPDRSVRERAIYRMIMQLNRILL